MAPVTGELQALLDLARALVARQLALVGHRREGASSGFAVSAAEVIETLTGIRPGLGDHDQLVEAAWSELERSVAASPVGILRRLREVLGLSSLDLRICAALLAPEIDVDLERAYTFAINDFTRKRPDVSYLSRLVGGGSTDGQSAVIGRLAEELPLRRHRLVVLSGDGAFMMRSVRIADQVAWLARGVDSFDEAIHGASKLNAPLALSDLVLAESIVQTVRNALAAPALRLLLTGQAGSGRGVLIEALTAEQGRRALRVKLAALTADPRTATDRLAIAMREAALRDAVAIFDGDDLSEEALLPACAPLARALEGSAVPVVIILPARSATLAAALPELTELAVPPPTLAQRATLWRQFLPVAAVPADEDIEAIAARYAFTGGGIEQVARRALSSARLRSADAEVSIDELADAARLRFSHRLGGLAQRLPAGFTWDDLVLPADTMTAVQEVVRFAHQRPFLLEQWGFARKLPYGRGISAILAGAPGTGKTMVAQLLARELGYELYRIDLSQVVNKYVGETEKNLSRVFDEAENAHAVLFFDEADSLFSKRTEVKSSNDRYANLEVNYLLHRMETFDGVTLLATNLEQGIDHAFRRRVRFSIQFELPEAAERELLWKSMFPAEAPIADDIDWKLLATTFEMSGGYIKKAAVRAALTAADATPRRAVSTEDMLAAARAEYREMGRIVAG